jgi:orotate phosphoribosyltransferase
MTTDAVLDRFRAAGALLDGHFRLSSGLHSPGYMQCALVLQWPEHAAALGAALGQATAAWAPTAVLSPALGGIVIGHEVARALGVRAIFAERQEGVLTLRRGFTLDPADRVLIVEDVVTTGGSTRETMHVAQAHGATVIGAAAIVDRHGALDLGVPFAALARVTLPTYDPAQCPLCARQLPLTKPGSRPTAL